MISMENEPFHPPPTPQVAELKEAYDSLYSVVLGLLLVLIPIAGTVCVFLLRQATYAKGDLNMVSLGYTNAMAQYERTRPIIDETVSKLQAYGRTNADFAPILAKYNLLPGATSAAPQTARPPAKK